MTDCDAALIGFRRAVEEDAIAVAAVFREARQSALPYLPQLHTIDDDVAYFRSRVLPSCQTWIAHVSNRIVGFCAFREGWVDHLYVHPEFARIGIGRALLTQAQRTYPQLRLWVFQRNERAMAFYSAMGFSCLERTDGSNNEEREPDALLYWSD